MLFDNEVENQNQLVKQFDNKINCASVANASLNKNIYLVESFLLYAHIKFTSMFSVFINSMYISSANINEENSNTFKH